MIATQFFIQSEVQPKPIITSWHTSCPHSASATCNYMYFKFWLVHRIVCVFCGWFIIVHNTLVLVLRHSIENNSIQCYASNVLISFFLLPGLFDSLFSWLAKSSIHGKQTVFWMTELLMSAQLGYKMLFLKVIMLSSESSVTLQDSMI